MLIPLLILAMAGQTPTNPSDRGKALFSDCQAQVRLSDANNIGEPPAPGISTATPMECLSIDISVLREPV